MCEDMPYLPSPWENTLTLQLPKHDDSLAIPYLGAWSNRPNQSSIQGSYLDTSGYQVLYKVGWSHSTKKATGPAVANFIREHIICKFGIPHNFVTDNGTPFVNKDVQNILHHHHMKHHKSTPYYPQGNGQAEAINWVLLRILSKMVHEYEGG